MKAENTYRYVERSCLLLLLQTQDQILLLQNAWAELTSIGVIWRSRHTPGIIQLSYGKHITLERAKQMNHEEFSGTL